MIMREIELSDLEIMLELHNNAEVQTYLGEEYPKGAEFMEQIIKNVWQREYRTIGHGRWAVVDKLSNEVMGWAGLKYLDDYKIVDLGYRFFPKFWGMGIATECSLALRDCAFERFNIKELWGMAWHANKASNIVLQKTGFKFVKRAPYDELSDDVMWYSMDKAEYQEIKNKEQKDV